MGGFEESFSQENFGETFTKLGNSFESAESNIVKLAECFQHIADDAEKRNMVPKEVMHIEGLINTEKIKIALIIGKDPSKINMFFEFPPEIRFEYVKMVLNGEIQSSFLSITYGANFDYVFVSKY